MTAQQDQSQQSSSQVDSSAQEVADATEQSSPQEVQESKMPRLLIVEDDPILGRMYSEKFKSEGYDVITAQDGESGLKMATEENVDVILLDVMLPRMSGIDLLEELRAGSKGSNVDVIALTNLADQKEKDRAIKLGVKDYLVKAMQTPEQVVTKVNKLIGK